MLQQFIFSSFQIKSADQDPINSNLLFYRNDINSILLELHKLYPNIKDTDVFQTLSKWILLFGWKQTESNDFRLFFLAQSLGKQRENIDLICLIQKRFSDITLWPHTTIRSFPFQISQLSNKVFFVTELFLMPNRASQVLYITTQLHNVHKELTTISSAPHDSKIQPTVPAHTEILHYLTRIKFKWPAYFENDLLEDFYTFMVLTDVHFRSHRNSIHLAKIITSHYRMRKDLHQVINLTPNQNYFLYRIFPAKIQLTRQSVPILGLCLSMFFPSGYERFEENHFLLALQRYYPNISIVPNSLHVHLRPHTPIQSFYLEIEKQNHTFFSRQEIKHLREVISRDFPRYIEKLVPMIFKKRNEEEVIRNILLLNREIKTTCDIPQMILLLEEVTVNSLIFNMLLVRVITKKTASIRTQLQTVPTKLEFTIDWSRIIGNFGKKYQKEAVVVRILVRKEPSFLRSDFSINFYLVRQRVLSHIHASIGKVRDYNGGILEKQEEQLAILQKQFIKECQQHPDFLEEFFYSLTPLEAQVAFNPVIISKLFALFLETIAKPLSEEKLYILKEFQYENFHFIVIRSMDPSCNKMIHDKIKLSQLRRDFLIHASVTYLSSNLVGYICKDTKTKTKLLQAKNAWIKNRHPPKGITIFSKKNFPSFLGSLRLDPRLSGFHSSDMIIRLLYEGLLRLGTNTTYNYGIAKSFSISSDQTTYTFYLRKSYWNNGEMVTAYDFLYSWQTIISPKSSNPFSHFFYPIKNARAIKYNVKPMSALGVHILDDMTLQIELENPCSYFLELICHPLYSPMHSGSNHLYSNLSWCKNKEYICNGPFQIKQAIDGERYTLIKNLLYWDKTNVKLDFIIFSQMTTQIALEQFKNKKIHWIGTPWSSWDPPLQTLLPKRCLNNNKNTHCIYWLVFNVEQFPFHNKKIRQALSRVLNRKKICSAFPKELIPAFAPLPTASYLTKYNMQGASAKALFQEGLRELNLSVKSFPEIILTYSNNEMWKKIALLIKSQWQDMFGIQCKLEAHHEEHFTTLYAKNRHIATVNWFSTISDPIYTFYSFFAQGECVNFPKWYNSRYQKLFLLANRSTSNREKYFAKMEEILLDETPIIPIAYKKSLFVKQKNLITPSPLCNGFIDLKFSRLN